MTVRRSSCMTHDHPPTTRASRSHLAGHCSLSRRTLASNRHGATGTCSSRPSRTVGDDFMRDRARLGAAVSTSVDRARTRCDLRDVDSAAALVRGQRVAMLTLLVRCESVCYMMLAPSAGDARVEVRQRAGLTFEGAGGTAPAATSRRRRLRRTGRSAAFVCRGVGEMEHLQTARGHVNARSTNRLVATNKRATSLGARDATSVAHAAAIRT